MEMVLINKDNKDYMEQIIVLESEVFGKNGAIDNWNLKPIVKYGRVYGLIDNKELVACVELIRSWDTEIVYLYGLAVKPKKIGMGLGSRLLSEVLELISKENILKIQLTVASDNIKAIKLYEKFGFKKIDFLEDEYGNGIHREFYEKKF